MRQIPSLKLQGISNCTGDHEELLGVTESVSKNLASVSHTGSTVLAEGWKVPSWMIHVHANQNLAYFEMLLWVHFLSVCFPGDPKDFQTERAEQLRNYFRNLHCQGLI